MKLLRQSMASQRRSSVISLLFICCAISSTSSAQVCALLSGGGYAEKVFVPAGQILPIPAGISLKDAAAFPEVACTVWSTVFMMGSLSAGESFLVHGGSSGIGTFAIQMAKHLGVRVFVTAGNEEKLATCKELGADVCINYKTEDFVTKVKAETDGKGVDVILDCIGAPFLMCCSCRSCVKTKKQGKQSSCCSGSREVCLASDRSGEGKTGDSQIFTIVTSSRSS